MIGDVKGKHCLIVDDEISTGGTLIEAANFLEKHGAKSVQHVQRIQFLPVHDGTDYESNLKEVVVCNSIPVKEKIAAAKAGSKVKVLPLASLFAKAIRRIHDGRFRQQPFPLGRFILITAQRHVPQNVSSMRYHRTFFKVLGMRVQAIALVDNPNVRSSRRGKLSKGWC